MSEAKKETPMQCECAAWGTECLVSGHHVRCDKFDPKPFIQALSEMMNGMEEWASDEDGIHSAAWPAYVVAEGFVVESPA